MSRRRLAFALCACLGVGACSDVRRSRETSLSAGGGGNVAAGGQGAGGEPSHAGGEGGGTGGEIGTGGAGGSVAAVCSPSSVEGCPYSGAQGTEGVGVCKAGVHVCNAQGTAWGSCGGEVTPSTDLCATLADEDCNGDPMPCAATPPWSVHFPLSLVGLEVDPFGDIVLFFGDAAGFDFGDGPREGATIVKLSGAGTLVWSKGFAGASGLGMAVDAVGNIAMTCRYDAAVPVDLGGGLLPSFGVRGNAGCLAMFDPAGNHLWSTAFGPAAVSEPGFHAYAYALTFDPQGDVVAGGEFWSAIDIGGTALAASGEDDGFVTKFSSTGAFEWVRQIGGSGGQVNTVDADAFANIVLGGYASGEVSLGGPPVLTGADDVDMFLAKLDPSGDVSFIEVFGDAENQYALRARFDATGDILVSAHVRGSVDFGGGPFVATVGGWGDAAIAKFDSLGNHLWSKSFGNGSSQGVGMLVGDLAGNLHASGYFEGALDFGSDVLQSQGGEDIFVAELSATGVPLGVVSFGGAKHDYGSRLVLDALDERIISGYFRSPIDFGAGVMTPFTWEDTYVANIGP